MYLENNQIKKSVLKHFKIKIEFDTISDVEFFQTMKF